MKTKKVKNLLNPTPSQKIWRNRKWAEALTTSKKCTGKLGDGKGSYCCLGVAQKVAKSFGIAKVNPSSDGTPHGDVAKFFGWTSTDPSLNVVVDGRTEKISAVCVNDGSTLFSNKKHYNCGLPHKKIAELVLNTFVRPQNPKQSFKNL